MESFPSMEREELSVNKVLSNNNKGVSIFCYAITISTAELLVQQPTSHGILLISR